MNIAYRQTGFIKTGDGVSRAGKAPLASARRLCHAGLYRIRFDELSRRCFGSSAAVSSRDEGENWGEHWILLEKNPEDLNIMSVSFLTLPGGELLLFYLKKSRKGDWCGRNLKEHLSNNE